MTPLPRYWLRSTGDTDEAIPAGRAGLLVSRVRLLETVVAGQPLADILDPRDATPLETIRAGEDGVVVLARRRAPVQAGDGTFLIARRESDTARWLAPPVPIRTSGPRGPRGDATPPPALPVAGARL